MGYKIREVRESLKMTQAELARRSGVSRGTIIALENNAVNSTNTKTLLKIANALNVPVNKIFFE